MLLLLPSSGRSRAAVRLVAPVAPRSPVHEEERPVRHRVAAHAVLGRGLAVAKLPDVGFIQEETLAVIAAFANEQ